MPIRAANGAVATVKWRRNLEEAIAGLEKEDATSASGATAVLPAPATNPAKSHGSNRAANAPS